MKDNKQKTSKNTINNTRKNKSSKPKKLSRKVLLLKTSTIKNKSNSNSNSKKPQTIQQLIKTKVLKEPTNLRVGYVSREINSKRYVVRLDEKNEKHFAIANKQEIACYLKLQENISKFIAIYKTGKSSLRNIKTAISLAIQETDREFPKCTTTKKRYSKKRELQSSKLNKTSDRDIVPRISRISKKLKDSRNDKKTNYNNLYYKIMNYLSGLYEW